MTHVDPDNEGTFEVCVIPSDLRETDAPKEAIEHALKRNHFDEQSVFAVRLALEEALTNAVKHGNSCDPCKNVTIRYAVDSEKAVIIVRDEGCGFSPEMVPDPTSPDRLPVPSGRGVMLMKAYMDEVEYRDDGREVRFMKRREATS